MTGHPNIMLALALFATGSTALADDEIFAITELQAKGRVVTSQFADFDGDGRNDLMLATLDGIPPDETRSIHVYLREHDGELPSEPSHSVPIPASSAAYDVADLRDAPGDELVILRPDGISILTLADGSAKSWFLPVTGAPTFAAGNDERGFDPYQLVFFELANEPWILVPQIGKITALTAAGTVAAEMHVGQRANYYVSRSSGLYSVESELQLYLDAPKLRVGDVDGDGQADVVSNTRHEIRVFLRDDNGKFPFEPSHSLPLKLLSREDHARGSGGVVVVANDLDNDGMLDLVISHTEGNFTDAVTTTYVYHNRDGLWRLAEPDDRFNSKGAVNSDMLLDVDGDEKLELVRVQFKFNVLEVVEFLLTRELDVLVSVHRLEEDGSYADKPYTKRKIGIGVSFDTFRPKGFMPTGRVDLNGDGRMDFVSSAGGKGIEVFLGSEDGLFSRRRARQDLPSAGVIRFDDFDDDGLPDFVLYDSQAFDSIVRVGRNTGALPESPE